MHAEFPAQALAAVATLVASLIAAAVAFVNLTLTKELKTSEFRQAWIDALREDLAKFLGAARAFARAAEVVHTFGPEYKDKIPLFIRDDKISELRYQAAETLSRIRLRLNPEEPEHEELLRLLVKAVRIQNEALANGGSVQDALDAVDAANDYARPVLKREWKRVKAGELPFRVVRNWLAPTIFIVSIAFLVFMWNGTFKI
ncbi:hypothetical protein [Pseudacidovorax sp. RU35E]|jgi:hypothetical protein|uniref:hypothetical protein n=1 Tax=Pseudacidovorax sp. RU35E TaxID=1907403 RepID=UPI0009550F79|nr:hypothetical protein [Pseudacidovorax sp. RU35E]SIR68815.1 hypothetical protein SAMN05880557_116118 [Pseudacidovorax sp. RU35E]